MKRQWIAIGLAALGLVMFGFIVSTFAAPTGGPLAQTSHESEPNDDFNQANPLPDSSVILGVLTDTVDGVDYFSVTTEPGTTYQVRVVSQDNPYRIPLYITIFNSSPQIVGYTDYGDDDGGTVTLGALDSFHYIMVESWSPSVEVTNTVAAVSYRLSVFAVGDQTPTSTPPGLDPYESNNHITETHDLPIAISASAPNANFFPEGDVDWFSYYAKNGRYYQAETSNLSGVDTAVAVYNPGGSKITSDNDGAGGFASRAQWQAAETGWYHIRVTNLVSSTASDTYDLTVSEIAAPPTETPTPVPASPGQIDRCEDNSNLDRACTIAPNNAETFNFVSPHTGADNDHYRVWIKPGMLFNCRTSNLSPGVDPNMIVYDQNRTAIGGNDDVAPGDYNSAFSYYATYSGWLYVLVGYGNRTPSDIAASSYTLNCSTSQSGAATPTSQAAVATATPRPGAAPTSTPVPVATPEPVPQLSVRVLATPVPGAVVTPAPRFVPIALLVYYDANDDGQPGAGEGIGGVSAQVYDAATNRLLAQGSADDRGHLEFTVAAQGPVRVSIPFLGFSQLVAAHGGSIYVRVAAASGTGGAS